MCLVKGSEHVQTYVSSSNACCGSCIFQQTNKKYTYPFNQSDTQALSVLDSAICRSAQFKIRGKIAALHVRVVAFLN